MSVIVLSPYYLALAFGQANLFILIELHFDLVNYSLITFDSFYMSE